jgi:DNA-binding NarL/FixJ family response regulator
MRVVIAEDSVLLREGISRLLADAGHEVVSGVGDGPSLIAAVREHDPDISIVDVRMPPSFRDEGIRASLEIRKERPDSPILVLSQYVEAEYASELLESGTGSVGYLLKDRVSEVSSFIDAVRQVAGGGTVLDPEVISQLVVHRRKDDPISTLTPREREVLALMAEGKTNASIADAIFVSHGAVEKHVRNIFMKLGLMYGDENVGHRRVLAVLSYLRNH